MLTKREVRQLAFEISRDRFHADKNEAYHAHIHNWGKARGGVEIGAWDAWSVGWDEGRKVIDLKKVEPADHPDAVDGSNFAY